MIFGEKNKIQMYLIFRFFEQSCSMAADVYARVNKYQPLSNIFIMALNAINGVFGAYTDFLLQF